MPIQPSKLFEKVLAAQQNHITFLNSTEYNLSYFLFGKKLSIMRGNVFPEVDIINILSSYKPSANNPIGYLVANFIEEIVNTPLVLRVLPYPFRREPYNSFADYLEERLLDIHRKSKRMLNIGPAIFEILNHGYFGIYTTGDKYYFLTAYDLFPGDTAIPDFENQPFLVRKTKIFKGDLMKSKGFSKDVKEEVLPLSDLDNVPLYDVWVKNEDLNIVYSESGRVAYKQVFPYPKVYPFFKSSKSEVMNSFYNLPILSQLCPIQDEYQKSIGSVEDSSKSIAKPLLVYDADANIDVDKLQRALREGYRQIIVGKNREGDIRFIAPGRLPVYATSLPERHLNELRKHIGITEIFMGTGRGGLRERGAITRLIKAAFRKLYNVTFLLEQTFADLDLYLIEYLRQHKFKFKLDRFKQLEEILSPEAYYLPQERFGSFSTEDTTESQAFTIRKWHRKLIPHEQALEELGYSKPRKILKKIREETKETVEFQKELKGKLEKPAELLINKVWNRIKGQVEKKFTFTPITDDKLIVQCAESEKKKIAFLLSDLADQVLIDPYPGKEVPPIPEEMKKKEIVKPPEKEVVPPKGRPLGTKEVLEKTKRLVSESPPVPEEEMATERTTVKEKPTSQLPRGEFSTVPEREKPFSEGYLEELVRASSKISKADQEKYFKLEGMYITEPHANWIFTGKKTLLVKARLYPFVLNKSMLLCGRDKVYGVIIVRNITDKFDFTKTQKFHLVTDKQARNWWPKARKLYLYMFEFHPFEVPLSWVRPKGIQTFVRAPIEIKKEPIGLPFKGDIKPVAVKPWRIPTSHKPEKRAFKPHEVFSVKRLKEIIPEGTYDVSFKVDGLRAFLWVHENKARMFSDTGAKWPASRIQPILKEAVKKFGHTVLLDGELVMKGIRRKDVAGYIHGKWKPTPEQLASLRYICWDILYVKDRSIASQPFSKRSAILDLYLSYKRLQKGKIQRVWHTVARNREGVAKTAKKLASSEGVVIRDVNASYWATHSTYKCKFMFDVDARVFAVAKTKTGLPIFYCELRDGTYIGSTYAQSEVKAKPGEVIRVNIDHVSIRPDGSVNWYAPKPRSWKEGKITPKKISTTQVGIGGPDRIDLVKEIYLVTGGTEQKWNEWHPKHLVWKKDEMLKLKERIKRKVKEGVEPAKII